MINLSEHSYNGSLQPNCVIPADGLVDVDSQLEIRCGGSGQVSLRSGTHTLP